MIAELRHALGTYHTYIRFIQLATKIILIDEVVFVTIAVGGHSNILQIQSTFILITIILSH